MYVYSCTIMCCTVFGNLFCHPLSWFWAPSCLQQNYRRCKSQKFCPIVFWSCHSRFLRGQCDVFKLLCFVQLTGRNQNILGLKGPKIQKTKKCLICEIFKYLFWTSNQWISDIFAEKTTWLIKLLSCWFTYWLMYWSFQQSGLWTHSHASNLH